MGGVPLPEPTVLEPKLSSGAETGPDQKETVLDREAAQPETVLDREAAQPAPTPPRVAAQFRPGRRRRASRARAADVSNPWTGEEDDETLGEVWGGVRMGKVAEG